MRPFVLSTAFAIASLGFADIGTAHAQVIVTGGYSEGYYQQGYTPGYYNGNGFQQASGYSYNNYGYNNFPSYGYNNFPSYGYNNYSPALSSYYSFYRRGAVGNGYNYNRRYR